MTQRQLDLWVTPEAKAAQLGAQCLKELLQKGLITKEEARFRAQNKEDF